MNKLIEDFAERCYVNTGNPHTDHFEYWKFAELIINTCANVAHNTQYKHSHAHSVGDCATAIKEYFGIGMSTEDKKNLIKQLLGVNNDDELA